MPGAAGREDEATAGKEEAAMTVGGTEDEAGAMRVDGGGNDDPASCHFDLCFQRALDCEAGCFQQKICLYMSLGRR